MTSGKTNYPIIFFGTEEFSLIALRALHEEGYDIRAVVTKPDSVRGRGHKITKPSVKVYAESVGLPVWQPQKLSEITDDIVAIGTVAGVLVSYGKIIPHSTLELFSPAIINLHPSLLPHYRGPSPIESAILHGDRETGVSIMQLTAEMDAGPVYIQERFSLSGHETKPELYQKLGELGTAKLLAALPYILNGTLPSIPQDDSNATYCNLLTKEDSLLAPQTMTASEAERRVRAFIGFPKTRLELLGEQRIITSSHVAETPKTPLDVAFSDGKFLCIDELVSPSGKTVSATSFLNGYTK